MPPFVLKINESVLRGILRGETGSVVSELQRRGQAVAAAAAQDAELPGDAFAVDTDIGPHRARVVVVTATAEAMVAEAVHRSLTRAFDAGRK